MQQLDSTSVRLIVCDPKQKILLMNYDAKGYVDPESFHQHKTFWVTPGGKVEKEESFTQAALRELFEETGIIEARIVMPAVWYNETFLMIHSLEKQKIKEYYFLVHVDSVEPTIENLIEDEKEEVLNIKWWTVQEIKDSKELFFPKNFAHLLEDLLKQFPEKTKILHA